MAKKNKIASTAKEWWDLVRADFNKYNKNCHPEDCMSLTEWVSGMDEIYGWRVEGKGMYEDLRPVRI
ncbi:MAG: hypothetical protein ACFFKA_00110 [Candidatus Thorarchaeota archaeon]